MEDKKEWLFMGLLVIALLIDMTKCLWLYLLLYPGVLLWLYYMTRLLYADWKELHQIKPVWKKHRFDLLFYVLLVWGLIDTFVNFWQQKVV